MAAPIVVNGDTSLVLIDTKSLTANQSEVVILSTINYPGRNVTIRDSLGYLSSPQSIIVSTQAGVTFADGTSSIVMTRPYSYLTVTSRDAASWNLKNSFAFPQNLTVANAASLITNAVVTSNLYASYFISTPYLNIDSFTATSSLAVYGPTFMSTMLVGTSTNVASTDPGYTLYVQGVFKTMGGINIEGDTTITGNISTGSNLYVLGGISTMGNFGALGDIMTMGNIRVPNGSIIANNLEVYGGAAIGGNATFSNSVSITSNLSVGNLVTTSNYITSTLTVASSINFQEKYITYRGYDLLFSDAATIPGISSVNITASNSIETSTLTVYKYIDAQQVESFNLGTAAILNPGGSLSISSITANQISFSNTVTTSVFTTSSVTASTMYLTGNIYATPNTYIETGSITANTMSTGLIYADTLTATNFTTTSLSLSELNITTRFVADNISTFSASNVFINNTGGTFSTGSLFVDTLIAASSIRNVSGQYTTTSENIAFTASNVYMNNLDLSTLTASSLTTSSITATQITMGSTPGTDNAPYFTLDTTSTNVVVSGGPGDFLTPFFISNVAPPGIGAGDPYQVEASFRLNFPFEILPGYYATISGLNLFPNGEANSQISLLSIDDTNPITTLYGIYGTDQSYSTPPNTGGIPVPEVLPTSFIHVVGTMYGASAFSLQFQSVSNDNYVGVDPNTFLTINNGVIKWPYSLNGTTIQNSLNDMSIRSIYYYGALNFASDPSLKENIEDADLERCVKNVRDVPLRRFKYVDPYLSTFQQKDRYRLGFIATELEKTFPKSITYTHLTEVPGYNSTIRMIDTQQIEMAHIGATKYLMNKVSSLYVTLNEVALEISTLKNVINL